MTEPRTEAGVAETWLLTTLLADSGAGGVADLTGGRIFGPLAPQGAEWPYVVFSYLSGTDLMVQDGTRVWAAMTYLIEAIDQRREYDRVDVIAARMDAVLHRAHHVDVNGGEMAECVRVQPSRRPFTVGASRFVHAGGLYSIKARLTA